MLKLLLSLFAAALLLAGCETASESDRLACLDPDNLTQARGKEYCLVIRTKFSQFADSPSTLIVFLHGDVSKGGPADYQFRSLGQYASSDVIAVAMLRPGYYDRYNNRSTGSNNGRRDSYTRENVEAIADALSTLKRHHKVKHLVVLGHSGGAAIAGVILGYQPGLVDGAILISCPCNLARWRADRRPWMRSLSPHKYVDEVPVQAKILAITGANDHDTKPYLAKEYVSSLRDRGIDASVVIIADGSHGFDSLDWRGPFKMVVSEFLRSFKSQ